MSKVVVKKPKFNFSISLPREPHHMARIERVAKGKLSIISAIEDMGGYNFSEKIELLAELRRRKTVVKASLHSPLHRVTATITFE